MALVSDIYFFYVFSSTNCINSSFPADLNSDKIQSANVPIKKIKKEVTQMSAKKRKSKSKH